jgi:hypothetical protein
LGFEKFKPNVPIVLYQTPCPVQPTCPSAAMQDQLGSPPAHCHSLRLLNASKMDINGWTLFPFCFASKEDVVKCPLKTWEQNHSRMAVCLISPVIFILSTVARWSNKNKSKPWLHFRDKSSPLHKTDNHTSSDWLHKRRNILEGSQSGQKQAQNKDMYQERQNTGPGMVCLELCSRHHLWQILFSSSGVGASIWQRLGHTPVLTCLIAVHLSP